MSEPRRRSAWPTIFAGVVLLAIAYGGAYRFSLDTFAMALGDIRAMQKVVVPDKRQPEYVHPAFSVSFAPANWVDRTLIRPQYWRRNHR